MPRGLGNTLETKASGIVSLIRGRESIFLTVDETSTFYQSLMAIRTGDYQKGCGFPEGT
jgi:hypothetical protein